MINHILLKDIIYRIEEKKVEKSVEWIEKDKEDYGKLQEELSGLNKLKGKYLTGSGLACSLCYQSKHFSECWDCYFKALNRIKSKERNFDSMSFVEKMNFNEAKRGYPEPNEEQKKEIKLNNFLKVLPQEIKKKESEIEKVKKKMEDKTIWQKQISEEKDFSLIKSVDTNKKFVEHPNVELRFFKHNRKDEWENILDKLNSEIQAKYPQTVFVGENKEKIKQNFIYELERSG